MKKNDYRKAEGLLFNYPILKAEIRNLEIDKKQLRDIMGIHGQSDNIKASTSTYAFNSSVENEVVSIENKEEYIDKVIISKQRLVDKIDNALSVLSEDERELVELRYFHRISIDRLAMRYSTQPDTIYKRKKKLILEITNIL